MHNLPKVIVIGALVLVALMFGLPMLSGPPRTTVSPPVPANEATRVSVVATTGIPEKPSDVWVIASVGVFQGHVAIEGGTMSIANMPVEAVMHAKLPPEWTGGVGIELGQVTKGVTGDGYVVPGVQVMDAQGKINIEVIDDPETKTVTIKPLVPLVILHSYVDLKSLRWTSSDKSILAFSVDDTKLVEFAGDQLQTQLDTRACTEIVTDQQGRKGTAVELGKININEFLTGILTKAYDSAERQLQAQNPAVHVIRPTIKVEWPDAPCYVIPKQRPDAPGGARP